MRNRENDKFDSGRTHPEIYKYKECVLPLSTRQRDYTSKIARTLFRNQDSGRCSPAIESIAGEYTTVSNF
jgi:hypothetical protein